MVRLAQLDMLGGCLMGLEFERSLAASTRSLYLSAVQSLPDLNPSSDLEARYETALKRMQALSERISDLKSEETALRAAAKRDEEDLKSLLKRIRDDNPQLDEELKRKRDEFEKEMRRQEILDVEMLEEFKHGTAGLLQESRAVRKAVSDIDELVEEKAEDEAILRRLLDEEN